MDRIDDETLMAYADGELSPAKAAEVEAVLRVDEEARDTVARYRESAAVARGAFAYAMNQPVPERLLRAARGGAVRADRWAWLRRLPMPRHRSTKRDISQRRDIAAGVRSFASTAGEEHPAPADTTISAYARFMEMAVNPRKVFALFAFATVLALAFVTETNAESGQDSGKKAKSHEPSDVRLLMPMMNPVRGMRLFASKGCVVCHAINGVGGEDAPALDAHAMNPTMNPFDLVAKMWRMAPAMIAAQEEELGSQITFSGDEIADIIAFIHDDAQQHKFTKAMIPPRIKKLMRHTQDDETPKQDPDKKQK